MSLKKRVRPSAVDAHEAKRSKAFDIRTEAQFFTSAHIDEQSGNVEVTAYVLFYFFFVQCALTSFSKKSHMRRPNACFCCKKRFDESDVVEMTQLWRMCSSHAKQWPTALPDMESRPSDEQSAALMATRLIQEPNWRPNVEQYRRVCQACFEQAMLQETAVAPTQKSIATPKASARRRVRCPFCPQRAAMRTQPMLRALHPDVRQRVAQQLGIARK